MIAAVLITGMLIIGPAFHSHIAIRIFIAPLLAGLVAASIASIAALIPAAFISIGCDLSETWGVVSMLVAVAVGMIVGIGTVVGAAVIAIRSWRTT